MIHKFVLIVQIAVVPVIFGLVASFFFDSREKLSLLDMDCALRATHMAGYRITLLT